MYDETISFLVAYGFLPKTWSKEVAKATVQQAPSYSLYTIGEKINEWIDNIYFIPPHLAFLGLYSAAVMTWFILTGTSEVSDGTEVRREKRALPAKKSVDHKDPKKAIVKGQAPAVKEIKHDRGDDFMNKLEKVFKETPVLQAKIIDISDYIPENPAKKVVKPVESKVSNEIEKPIVMSEKPIRVNSKEDNNLAKKKRENIPKEEPTPSKDVKTALNKKHQSELRSERSILDLKSIHRSLQRKKNTTERFLRLLNEIQSDEVLSDTDKDFENERIQNKVDLTKPSAKLDDTKKKPIEKKTDKIKRQLATSGLYTKFLSVPEVQRKIFGADISELRDINGKAPAVNLKRHPRNAVSAHRPFRLGPSTRHNTELRSAQKRRLDRESQEPRSSSPKAKRSF